MKRLQEQSSTGNFESVKQQSIGQRSISLGHQITQRRETDFDHKINEIKSKMNKKDPYGGYAPSLSQNKTKKTLNSHRGSQSQLSMNMKSNINNALEKYI